MEGSRQRLRSKCGCVHVLTGSANGQQSREDAKAPRGLRRQSVNKTRVGIQGVTIPPVREQMRVTRCGRRMQESSEPFQSRHYSAPVCTRPGRWVLHSSVVSGYALTHPPPQTFPNLC